MLQFFFQVRRNGDTCPPGIRLIVQVDAFTQKRVAFAEHIASHGCVYKRADIVAILTMAVDCMREQLLGGQKIQLGDLGDFSISINSIGAESAADYNPAIHVRKLNVNWSAGTRFQNLQEEAVFNLVATRKAARLVVKALKAGKTSVDLTGEAKEPENGGQA